MSEHDDNRDELARLIREHLEDRKLNTTAFVNQFPKQIQRSVYNWLGAVKVPRSTASIAALEEALGWKRGAVKEVLTAPITRKFQLSELRDWEKLDDEHEGPASRASELSTDELTIELVRRIGAMQNELEFLRGDHGNPGADVITLHGSVHERKNAFGLAALSTEAGRNMEHLEGPEQDK